jgi:hypothetical protein
VDDFMHTMRKLCNYEIFIEMLIWIGQKLRGGEIRYIYIHYYTHDAHDVFVEIQKKITRIHKDMVFTSKTPSSFTLSRISLLD